MTRTERIQHARAERQLITRRRETEHTTMTHNPNCDGAHCLFEQGEVRVYPLGGGANAILCRACWTNENKYRFERGNETRTPENWPQEDWNTAKVYDGQ